MCLSNRLKHGKQNPDSKLCVLAICMVISAWGTKAGGSLDLGILDPTQRPPYSTQARIEQEAPLLTYPQSQMTGT